MYKKFIILLLISSYNIFPAEQFCDAQTLELQKSIGAVLPVTFGQNPSVHHISTKTLEQFATIDNLLEALGKDSEEPIPLPNIESKKLFDQVIAYINNQNRDNFLKDLSNQQFLKLFEALNFLDCKAPKKQDNQTEQDNQFEHQLIGPFIRKILTDQRKRNTKKTIPDITDPKASLIDYFFHPYHHDRFNQLTRSHLAKTVFGQLLCNGEIVGEKLLLGKNFPNGIQKDTRGLINYIESSRKRTANPNPTSQNLAKLEPFIPICVMSSGRYFNYGFTHFPPDFATNHDYTQLISPYNSVGLQYNCLQSFPPKSAPFIGLSSLNLSYNNITAIPENCGLPALTELQLQCNQFKGPLNASVLNQFPLLVELNLEENMISAIEGPLQLQNLSILYISQNEFLELPKILGCIALQVMGINNNPFGNIDWKTLKQWAGDLPQLQHVYANNLLCLKKLPQKERERIRRPIRDAFKESNARIHF